MLQLLETNRTIMRPFEASDASAAFSWFSDPEVMRYIPLGPDRTLEETEARISRYMDHQKARGFSKWIILDRATQEPIGDSGFYSLPDGQRIELGYRLSRRFWGRGLATEVGQRWIEAAAEFTKEPSLFAFAHPENKPSLRVIGKLGFTFFQNENLYGISAPLYLLSV